MNSTFNVRGFFKPESSFHTIPEWKEICKEFVDLQTKGFDTRGGQIDYNPNLINLINKYFSHLLYIETEQFTDLTRRKVLDFIEDFVNHRVWGMENEFSEYLNNIDEDKISFFYSRGSIEPYVLLDSQFTENLYGSTDYKVKTLHWTTKEGLINILDGVKNGYQFSISTFTTQAKEFFRPESNILVSLEGELVAAFKSDAKTLATDKGNRAANMFRLSYIGGESNLCKDVEHCGENKTHLWNEIVVNPTKVLNYKEVNKY